LKVYYNFDNYHVQKPVVTVGVFDGVHKGHIAILDRVKHSAHEVQGDTVIVTFWPHPRLVLNQDASIKLINTIDEKLQLFEKFGVQHIVIIPFTEEFSKISSQQFIEDIMINKLKVNHLIIGFNHHFGKAREGNFELMNEYSKQFGFTLEKLDAQMVENEKVSSTLIRTSLNNGDIITANKYLGYDYMITGKVVEGKKIGRTIGFPTANVLVNQDYKLIPKTGVYAVEVEVTGKRYPGMLNVGYNPTIDPSLTKLNIEAHLLNFTDDLYEKDITLLFKQRIRNEIKFEGLDQLKKQLNSDKAEVLKILGV
jgi:riboflavin kinase / FMN adenylyltransferase